MCALQVQAGRQPDGLQPGRAGPGGLLRGVPDVPNAGDDARGGAVAHLELLEQLNRLVKAALAQRDLGQ